jgi:hypothetical protein
VTGAEAQMSEPPRRDDTAYVQGFIDKGALIPFGEYFCPDGVVFPGDYLDRARAAGRVPDPSPEAPEGAFRMSDPPGAKLTFAWGGAVELTGWILPPREKTASPGDILVGKDNCAFTFPHPPPADLEHVSYAVP